MFYRNKNVFVLNGMGCVEEAASLRTAQFIGQTPKQPPDGAVSPSPV